MKVLDFDQIFLLVVEFETVKCMLTLLALESGTSQDLMCALHTYMASWKKNSVWSFLKSFCHLNTKTKNYLCFYVP